MVRTSSRQTRSISSPARQSIDTSASAVLPTTAEETVALEPTQGPVHGASCDSRASPRERTADRVAVCGRAAQLLQDQGVGDHRLRIRRLRRLRLALMIEGQEGVTWDDWVALATACEEHGVEALFRSDHYISGYDETRPALDAWTTIAGLAARTVKLQLGTLVSPGTFRHPSVLARAAATADEISGGRVTLGMGAGWMEREHEAYGFEFATARDRVARFAEQLEIVQRQLREDNVDFAGEHYTLHGAPGLNRPDLPILVGGSAKPGTAEPAVRFADEYNTFFATTDEIRKRKRKLDEACERAGRDPATLRYSLMAPCVVGRDERELLESARRVGARFGREPQEVIERYGERGPVGTVEQVVERLKEIEGIGYERMMLQHLAHQDLDALALIGRELAPAVR
jgi:alkanesulfonate monooxygenase SsuD/methylene tetrahydromethanopterin reductase-like flavin-dependent oxidoreductase (luciferase family)